MALANGNTETEEQTWIDANITAVAQGVGIYDVAFTCTLDAARGYNNPVVTVDTAAKTSTITIGIGTKSRGHWVAYLKKRMVEVAKDLGIRQTIPTRIFAPKPLSVVETTPANWNLVWNEQFEDLSNWHWAQKWGNPKINLEEQGYPASWRNVHLIPGGGVIIRAERETYVGRDGATSEFSSGMLCSYPARMFNQGYFEARYRAPSGQGIHPAFFLYDADGVGAGYAQEHDISEHIGQVPWAVYSTNYLPAGAAVGADADYGTGDLSDGMHVYGYEWDSTNLKTYVDNVLYSTQSATGMTHNVYIVFTFALGSTFSGPVGHLEQFPKEMVIDYVKVWERA